MTDKTNEKALVRIRMDATLKEEFETALASMGLDISAAVTMLAVKVAKERSFPFTPSIVDKVPNKTTLKAMAEGRKLLRRRG